MDGSARFAASLKVRACCGDADALAAAIEVLTVAPAATLVLTTGTVGATGVARPSHSGRKVLTVNRIATQIVQTCANTSHNRVSIVR